MITSNDKMKLERNNLPDFLDQECLGAPNVTRRQSYEDLLERILKLKNQLDSANCEEQAHAALNAAEEIVNSLLQSHTVENDVKVEDILKDITAVIYSVKQHFVTISVLCNFLDNLINAINDIIAKEKKNDAEKLKAVFLALAEHADEIAQFVDLNKILSIQ